MSERTHYMPPEARGLTEEAEQFKQTMRGNPIKENWEHFTPQFVDIKVQELDLKTGLREIKDAQKLFQEARISQPEATVRIDSKYPIAVAHLGDLHFGSIYSNYKEILRKFDQIKTTPNMYVVFMSNLIENAIPAKYPDNMLTNAIPPDKQVIMMRQLIQELNEKNKVLGAVTSPCHEGWTYAATGQDINALLFGFEGRKFPVLENGGRLNIKMQKVTYKGGLYHMVGPMESQINKTHAPKQMNRFRQGMEADWVAVAHKHFASVEETYEGTGEHRHRVVYVRSGSEKGTGKIHDQFSIGRYGATGEPSGQIVELFPFKKNIVGELDFDTGVLMHENFYIREMIKTG